MTMKGGNTDELYADGNKSRLEMTRSLMKQHPEHVELVERWDHWHHKVDYSSFKKNKLKKKRNLKIKKGVNEYGMELRDE